MGDKALISLFACVVDELIGLNYSRSDFWRVSDFFALSSAAGFGVGGFESLPVFAFFFCAVSLLASGFAGLCCSVDGFSVGCFSVACFSA